MPLNNSSSSIQETIVLREIQGGETTYATRIFTLTGNPGSGQMLSFGDGNNSISFEYVDVIETYQGINIPILIGLDAEETQVNTITAYENFEGEKPLVVLSIDTFDGSMIILTSTIPGVVGDITLGAPADVGVSGALLPGVDAINLRTLNNKIDEILLLLQTP